MNLKKTKIIGVIGILIFSFIFHFAYDKFPNPLFAIFFPVNESIWEHMKILFTSIMFYSVIEYIIISKANIEINNYLLSSFIVAFLSIPIYLIMYLPLHYTIGHSMFLAISLMIICFIIIEIISYYLLQTKPIKYSNYIAIILTIVIYIIFGYLTYNPPLYDLFLDPENQMYGINYYTL